MQHKKKTTASLFFLANAARKTQGWNESAASPFRYSDSAWRKKKPDSNEKTTKGDSAKQKQKTNAERPKAWRVELNEIRAWKLHLSKKELSKH